MSEKALVLYAVFSLFILVGVAVLALDVSWFAGLDAGAALAINALPIGQGQLLAGIALYGREYFWTPVLAVMYFLGNRRTKLLALELAAALLVGIAVGEAAKLLLFRPRPYLAVEGIVGRIPTDPDSSFPSGHALIVAIGASFALAKFSKRSVSSLLTVEAILVGFSRVYVGVHYPSDVVAGAALGVFVALASTLVIERYLGGAFDRLAGLSVRLFREGPVRL